MSGSGKSTSSTSSVQGGGQPPSPGQAAAKAPTAGSVAWTSRQDHQHRPVADRTHAALHPHLHRAVRPHPRALLAHAGGAGAVIQAGSLLVQRQGWALRGLPRRRPDQDRDALPPDVYVPCEQCHGKRYNRETLEVRFNGRTIADVLDMNVEEAVDFFQHIPKIALRLRGCTTWAWTTSAGSARHHALGRRGQRVKLATSCPRSPQGRTLYILDEPTTGLHFADVQRLLECSNRLVDQGNRVVVIEHNLDVIKNADRIIDLGPEGARRAARGGPGHARAVAAKPSARTPAASWPGWSSRRGASGRDGRAPEGRGRRLSSLSPTAGRGRRDAVPRFRRGRWWSR